MRLFYPFTSFCPSLGVGLAGRLCEEVFSTVSSTVKQANERMQKKICSEQCVECGAKDLEFIENGKSDLI